MRTVYAIQFSLDPSEELGGSEVMEQLRGMAGNWVEAGYRRRWSEEIEVEFPSSQWNPMDGHSLTTTVQLDGDRELSTLNWAHLDDEDRNLVWRTEAGFAREDDEIDVNVRVQISSPRFELRPVPEYFVGRPRFVTDILHGYPCRIGTQHIPTSVRTIGVGDVSDFVTDVLEDNNRTLPVVLLSQDAWSEQPYTDPDELLYRVLGHAVVAEIDKHAGFDLTGLVGKKHSCWDGAIRIYWPGFNRTDDRYQPLFFPDRMDSHAERGEPIEDHLFNRLSAIAVLRYVEGDVAQTVQRHFREQRRSELAELRAELEAKEQEEAGELEQREKELLQALVRNDELDEENERLRRELETAQQNLADVARQIGETGGDSQAPDAEGEADFTADSVLEAVVEADRRYSGRLQVWGTAYDSADESDFVRPQEVFEALAAIAELSEEYFRSLDRGESMGTWENFFAERGIRYSPSEHKTTMTMYGDQRTFTEGEETRTMERHVTLGGGSRRNCVQIFFDEDPDRRTIHVGYCGRHLDFASQQT